MSSQSHVYYLTKQAADLDGMSLSKWSIPPSTPWKVILQ